MSAVQDFFGAAWGALNAVDIVFLTTLLIFTVRGIFRGFSGEIAGLIGMAIVFLGGWRFYDPLSTFIQKHTRVEDPQKSQLLAYFLAVIVILVVVNLLILAIRKLLHKVFEGPLERIGGGIAGFLKTAIILAILLFGIQLSGHPLLMRHFIEESWIGGTIGVRIPGWFDALRETVSPQPPNPEDIPDEMPEGQGK